MSINSVLCDEILATLRETPGRPVDVHTIIESCSARCPNVRERVGPEFSHFVHRGLQFLHDHGVISHVRRDASPASSSERTEFWLLPDPGVISAAKR